MIEIINTEVSFLNQSVKRSGFPYRTKTPNYITSKELTENDVKRMVKLAKTKGGTGHDNFLKGIRVSFDVKYPQYWTPQIQRYSFIDIVSSQSKMYTLTKNNDIKQSSNKYVLDCIADKINGLISLYNADKYPVSVGDGLKASNDYEMYMYIISNLPMGYEMWMGVSTNYLQLKTIYQQRRTHKLKEDWGCFCEWIKTLPFANELILPKQRK